MLKITHNAGFFSCCFVRLNSILEYYNTNKCLPEIVDSSQQFSFYKEENRDITLDFFEDSKNLDFLESNNSDKIYFNGSQFSSYDIINYDQLTPFIRKYFSPSKSVLSIKQFLINQYNIDPSNTCVIRFRGNDKIKETQRPSFEEFLNKAQEIQLREPNLRFLILTDQKEFLDYMIHHMSNCFYFQELPTMLNNDYYCIPMVNSNNKLQSAIDYFAAVLIASECKYIIHTSGNGELFLMLYRGNAYNTKQYLRPNEYIYGCKNDDYDPNKTNYWYDRTNLTD